MANINLGNDEFLVVGTGGDDVVTVDRALNFDVENLAGLNADASAAQTAATNAQGALNTQLGANAATINALDDAITLSGGPVSFTALTDISASVNEADAITLRDELIALRVELTGAQALLDVSGKTTALSAAEDALAADAADNGTIDTASNVTDVQAAQTALDDATADNILLQNRIDAVDTYLDQLNGNSDDLIGDLQAANTWLTDADAAVTAAGGASDFDGETFDGNGGTDSLVLTEESLADLLELLDNEPTASFDYDAVEDEWTFEDGNAATGTVVAENGFRSLTTADGTVLQAGVATSGISDVSVNGNGTAAKVNLARIYTWDGSEFSVNTELGDLDPNNTATTSDDGVTIISVDGQIVANVGPIFQNADGQFSISNGGKDVSFTAETAAITAQGNAGDTATFTYDVVVEDAAGNQYTVAVSYNVEIPFTIEDDTWVGTDGDDFVNAASPDGGNDNLNGGAGNDHIDAGSGNDTLIGGEGNDILHAYDGDDYIEGNSGEDNIQGGNGNDTVIGGADNDEIDGNDGDDELRGGAGNDDIEGGEGNDMIGGAGGDDDLYGDNGDDTLFGAGGEDDVYGGNGADKVNGGGGDDYLEGNDGNDTLKGGDGDDELYGGANNDELRGGAGEDDVYGGDGDDLIFSSLGGDYLEGGNGDDTFVLKAGTGNTTIGDFGANGDSDKLDVSELGLTNLAAVTAISFETTDGVTMVIDADTSVALEGVSLSDLSIADFDFA